MPVKNVDWLNSDLGSTLPVSGYWTLPIQPTGGRWCAWRRRLDLRHESENHVELRWVSDLEHGEIWTSMEWWKTSETMNSQQIDIVEHRFLLLDCHCFCSCNIPQSGCWTDTCRLSVGSKHQSHLRAAATTQHHPVRLQKPCHYMPLTTPFCKLIHWSNVFCHRFFLPPTSPHPKGAQDSTPTPRCGRWHSHRSAASRSSRDGPRGRLFIAMDGDGSKLKPQGPQIGMD